MKKAAHSALGAFVFLAVAAFFVPVLVNAYTTGSYSLATDGTLIFQSLTSTTGNRGDGYLEMWSGVTGSTTTIPTLGGPLGATWSAAGVNVWTNNLGCTLPSSTTAECNLNTTFNIAANLPAGLPQGNYTVEFRDTSYSSGIDLVYPVYFDGVYFWAGTANVANIDFSQYYTPLVFSTSSSAIAASSSLWGAFASTSVLTATCNTGNLFGDALCTAFSYLFVPNPNVLNQYAGLPGVIETRFPFSWVVGVQSAFNGLTASSTANMIDLEFDYPTMGIGTSTPLGLSAIAPKIEVFGTSTIEKYIGSTYWALFQTLISLAIWLTLTADVFFTVRNSMHRV